MTLQARLALALAVLAAISVVVVAVITYVATDHRLHDNIDAELASYAARLHDPDGRFARQLCSTLSGQGTTATPAPTVPTSPAPGSGGPGAAPPFGELGGLLAGLPQGAVQCLDVNGTVTGWTGPVDLPVTDDARALAASSAEATAPRPRHPETQVVHGDSYRVVTVPVPGGGAVRIARSLADTDSTLGSIRDLSIGLGIAVIALAAAAGWFIARRTIRPVLRLTDAAEAVGATGRLEVPVPSAGKGEVGRLSRAFGSMLDALNRSRSQQQRLVQDAGHELRTPLTSLRANIGTLRLHPDLAAGPRSQLLADLDSELRELSQLVDELVALTVDRYDDEPEQTVHLDELVRRAVERAERRTGRSIGLDAAPATAVARPEALLRAVANLLDNAAKFTPQDTPIEVAVRPRRIEVRDHGPGIDPADLDHVFDRFYRAVQVRSLPGSGLGLSIVREAVERADGTVTAANAPDGGARFTIELPPA